MISRLLTEYPGLYVDFSWVIFDEIIAVSEVTMQDWVDMSEKHADRIMIGSDVLGDAFEQIGVINSRFNKWTTALSF